jgi:hypothetical protein
LPSYELLRVVVYEVAILYRCDQGGLVQHVAKVGLAPFGNHGPCRLGGFSTML